MCSHIHVAKTQGKQHALKLRRQGKSIKDIAETLDVSKGSMSVWCQDVVLTKKQSALLKKKQDDAGNAGRILGAEMNKKKWLDAIMKHLVSGKQTIDYLSQRDLLILGIGLY